MYVDACVPVHACARVCISYINVSNKKSSHLLSFFVRILIGTCSSNLKNAVEPEGTKQH